MIQTSVGIQMDAAVLENYFRSLINLFFKILPLKESKERSLETYMRSLQSELLGCKALVVAIHEDSLFLSLFSNTSLTTRRVMSHSCGVRYLEPSLSAIS